MMIKLGNWEPDSAGLSTGILSIAKNAFPNAIGWGPMASLTTFAESGSSGLPADCRGLTFARSTTTGDWSVFAGTATKLYRFSSGAWSDVSRTSGGDYSLTDGDIWSFAQFGNQLIATHIADDPQVFNVDSGTNFAALGGSPPRAKYVWVTGDFVFLGALATNLRKVINSGINNATSWTIGTDLCDEQEFPDGGNVMGGIGGEYGFILQDQNAWRRSIFQPGSEFAFRFERLDGVPGSVAPYGFTPAAGSVFYVAEQGFCAFGANGFRAIGTQRVNRWFRENSDPARIREVVAAADPQSPRILWAFYGSAASTTYDRVIIYDWQLDRWSYGEEAASMWASVATPGYTQEDLDDFGTLETLEFSLDSYVWQGGRPSFGAVNPDGFLSFLDGEPLTAEFTTDEMQISMGARSYLDEMQPLGLYGGATVEMRANTREYDQGSQTVRSFAARSSRTGRIQQRASGRLHQFTMRVTHGAPAWTHAQGFNINARPDGDQ